jgi:hypothetical protein
MRSHATGPQCDAANLVTLLLQHDPYAHGPGCKLFWNLLRPNTLVDNMTKLGHRQVQRLDEGQHT